MQVKTHTSLHLYLHFYSLSVADGTLWSRLVSDDILSASCPDLVPSDFFNRVMVTGMKAGGHECGAGTLHFSVPFPSVSLRKTITDCGVIFYLHPMAYPALASYSACYQASRFVQDSSLQASLLKGTIALTGFLANVMKSLLPHPFFSK